MKFEEFWSKMESHGQSSNEAIKFYNLKLTLVDMMFSRKSLKVMDVQTYFHRFAIEDVSSLLEELNYTEVIDNGEISYDTTNSYSILMENNRIFALAKARNVKSVERKRLI